MSWDKVEQVDAFTRKYDFAHTIMTCNGKKAVIKLTPRLNGEDSFHLPPGRAARVFLVDSLPGCPEDWVRGEGSYVVPIHPDVAFWFDWTQNDHLNTAVLSSVKGLNPITGLKIDGIKLEKYKEKCPVHNEPFNHGRYCSKCDYKWPAQSYVSSPNTLWWDGFRQPDGTVRQFFFSEEVERDVAAACLGGEQNTVPAFGFAFFEPKVRRATPPPPQYRPNSPMSFLGIKGFSGESGYSGTSGFSGCFSGFSGSAGPRGPSGYSGYSGISGSSGFSGTSGYSSPKMGVDLKLLKHLLETKKHPTASNDGKKSCRSKEQIIEQKRMDLIAQQNYYSPSHTTADFTRSLSDSTFVNRISDVMDESEITEVHEASAGAEEVETCKFVEERHKPAENAKVSVGAGARIRQDLLDDPVGLDEWKTESSGLIRLYFVFESKFERILNDGGIRDLEGSKEGFLKGLKVG